MSRRTLIAASMALALALVAGVGALAVGVLQLDRQPRAPYTVVRGDTLFEIARDHGVSVDDLRSWNGIEGDLIEVGQILQIRTGPAQPAIPSPRKVIPTSPLARTAIPKEAPALTLPRELPCLAGPELEGGADEQMAASAGLSHDQVSATMNAFLPNVLPCFADAEAMPERTLLLEFRVACTGRVASVRALDRGDWEPALTECVIDALGYAPFPAHDLPDGDSFRFPLQFTPDG